MEKENVISEKKHKSSEKIYSVAIHNNKNGLLVRKSVEIGGKLELLGETYVLNTDDAAMLQQQWMQELTGICLN